MSQLKANKTLLPLFSEKAFIGAHLWLLLANLLIANLIFGAISHYFELTIQFHHDLSFLIYLCVTFKSYLLLIMTFIDYVISYLCMHISSYEVQFDNFVNTEKNNNYPELFPLRLK